MKTPRKVATLKEACRQKAKNLNAMTRKERDEVKRLFKRTGLTKAKLLKLSLGKKSDAMSDDVVTLMNIFDLKPETVDATPKPSSKAKASEPKIKEDKEEDVREEEAVVAMDTNGAETKGETADEADGPTQPQPTAGPGFLKRTVSKLWNFPLQGVNGGVPYADLAPPATSTSPAAQTPPAPASTGCVIC